ncbi:MAG: hypothetical protein KBE65_18250 [Phycisphaerae bacterium]|nr:hypothetical protein [Phycisphaerae bacterium]
MMKEKLLQRVDQLIEEGKAVLCTCPRYDDDGSGNAMTDWSPGGHSSASTHQSSGLRQGVHGKMQEFRAASLSFIGNVYGEKHSHFTEFRRTAGGPYPEDVECGLGILTAIRGEIAGDWLFTIKGLVTAEVFTDYVEMAEYLLHEQFKDAAAVIAGSTLEEHLRQLCRKNGIPVARDKDGKDVPLKADQLNADLTKAGVYTTLDQKLVTAWLGLRNKAAHGDYGEYNPEQVKGMITGITEFMARVAV